MESIQKVNYEYKSSYTVIFTLFYFFEGVHQGIPYIFTYLLLKMQGSYDASMILYISSATSMPWAFKFIVGLINDRWGSKKMGRRFPFILFGGLWCAVWWILMAIMFPDFSYGTSQIYKQLLFFSVMTNIGAAVADTAIDGLILDITPKEKLGRIESITWTALLAGSTLIGGGLGFLLLQYDVLWILFAMTGVFVLITSILPVWIKELPVKKEVDVKSDLKRLITEKENYPMYAMTFWDSVANPIVMTIFTFFILISMGKIDADETLLSLASGTVPTLFVDTVIIQLGYGVGVVIGCYVAGKVSDRNRKLSVDLGYIFYIPICLLCILFKGLILGNIANLFFGFSYGVLSISGQTIRGDIAKEHFKDLKSTYFALLISLSNLGLAFGNFIGGFIFKELAIIYNDFTMLTFWVMAFCASTLAISYYFFRKIKPKYYEFDHQIKKKSIKAEIKDVEV